MIIKEGHEWQIRAMSEAALELDEFDVDSLRVGSVVPISESFLRKVYDAGYAQGVGEVLRLLIADDTQQALMDSEAVLARIYDRYLEGV